jgi:hypothetical protein
MAKPTRKQIRAVRAVLYKRERLRRLLDDIHSIDVLMNLDNPAQPEGAPLWVYPANGQIGEGVAEAVKRCRRVAGTLRDIREELAELDVPDRHKHYLRESLEDQAKVWVLRGEVWAATDNPNVETAVKRLASRQRAAFDKARKVRAYLRKGESAEDLRRLAR